MRNRRCALLPDLSYRSFIFPSSSSSFRGIIRHLFISSNLIYPLLSLQCVGKFQTFTICKTSGLALLSLAKTTEILFIHDYIFQVKSSSCHSSRYRLASRFSQSINCYLPVISSNRSPNYSSSVEAANEHDQREKTKQLTHIHRYRGAPLAVSSKIFKMILLAYILPRAPLSHRQSKHAGEYWVNGVRWHGSHLSSVITCLNPNLQYPDWKMVWSTKFNASR